MVGPFAFTELPCFAWTRGWEEENGLACCDEGSDFTSTAANRDMLSNRSQSQYESLLDRKGLSNFHSPHALTVDYSYALPNGRYALLRGWQISGATLLKTGTPLSCHFQST